MCPLLVLEEEPFSRFSYHRWFAPLAPTFWPLRGPCSHLEMLLPGGCLLHSQSRFCQAFAVFFSPYFVLAGPPPRHSLVAFQRALPSPLLSLRFFCGGFAPLSTSQRWLMMGLSPPFPCLKLPALLLVSFPFFCLPFSCVPCIWLSPAFFPPPPCHFLPFGLFCWGGTGF